MHVSSRDTSSYFLLDFSVLIKFANLCGIERYIGSFRQLFLKEKYVSWLVQTRYFEEKFNLQLF